MLLGLTLAVSDVFEQHTVLSCLVVSLGSAFRDVSQR